MPSYAKTPRTFQARQVKVLGITQIISDGDKIQHSAVIQDLETTAIRHVTMHGSYVEKDPLTLSIQFTEMSVSGTPGRIPHRTKAICKDVSRTERMRLVRGSNNWLTLLVKEPEDTE